MRTPNYDKFPSTKYSGKVFKGWNEIRSAIAERRNGKPVFVDFYTGVYEKEVVEALSEGFDNVILTSTLMKSEDDVRKMTYPFITDDVLFGYMTNLRIMDFFSEQSLELAKTQITADTLIIGTGATLLAEDGALVVYADMARWEIQQRFRRREVKGLGIDNSQDPISVQYKRGLFCDWKVLDLYKDKIFDRIDLWLDTNDRTEAKMIDSETFMKGIEITSRNPFRVVPFFDPAPWGGKWMREVCDLDKSVENYGWCFDCVPEENSLLFEISGTRFEIPSNDLVLLRSRALLGERVEARFGKDFPIRFDFLDTIGGGNLSLQVHPTFQFIHENMGLPYTQDESYYLLDATEDAVVYLGVKNGVDKTAMIEDLRAAQRGEIIFDAEKYVNKLPAKKHDHYLIPAGTIHCSGGGSMVLEISATPSIFTFKLWDWGRLGLDGKPRPINVERGKHVIQWNRNTDYVMANLANHFEPTGEGDGWSEERTGLHPNEFIETRRTRFTKPVLFKTNESVNVLNLVDGEEAVVESPRAEFEPFVVHYAETFIIPECCKEYTIRPYGRSEGKECMVINAYVRMNA